MRAYPTSFRQILDLVARNGLEGDELKAGQNVPWPAWHEQWQLQRQVAGPSQGPPSSSSSSGGQEAEGSARAAAAGAVPAPSAGSDVSGSGSGGNATESAPSQSKVQVVLVGATVTEAEVEEAVARHWVTEPVVVRVGAPGRVPKGLRHRALVVGDSSRALAALVAMLRRDLEQAGQDEEPARVRGVRQGQGCKG
jgi:hypothetical protein